MDEFFCEILGRDIKHPLVISIINSQGMKYYTKCEMSGMATVGTQKLKRQTVLKRWIAVEMRWYRNVVSRGSAVH